MPTFKACIYAHQKRADGTYNVKLRITHKRVVRNLSTNIYVASQDLTRGLKFKSQNDIDKCNNLIAEYRDICNGFGIAADAMTVDEIISKIKNDVQTNKGFRLDFFEFAQKRLTHMTSGTSQSYQCSLNALKRFIGREVFDISEITSSFLNDFERFIEDEPVLKSDKNGTLHQQSRTKVGGRAVSLYMSNVRALHNMAKQEYNDEDNGVIRIPQSPFNKYKVKRPPKSKNRNITVEAIQKIINLNDVDRRDGSTCDFTRHNLAKDCFLLSFALVGMNSTDLFSCGPAVGETLIYNRKKTESRREDNAEMHVRIDPCIKELIDKYRDPEGKRMFCFYHHYTSERTFNHALNHGLKKVAKSVEVDDLTFYSARHSWATIARSSVVGVDKATVHEALNHVDELMRITDIYIERDWSIIWKANERVLNLFDWSSLTVNT